VNVPPAAARLGLLWRDRVPAATPDYRRRIAVIVPNREEMLPPGRTVSVANRYSES